MTLEKTNKLLAVQARMRSGYNHNGARLILNEAQKEHSLQAVDQLNTTLEQGRISGFTTGTEFKT